MAKHVLGSLYALSHQILEQPQEQGHLVNPFFADKASEPRMY